MMINHSVHIFFESGYLSLMVSIYTILHSGTVPKPNYGIEYRAIPSINISLIKGRVGILTFMYVANQTSLRDFKVGVCDMMIFDCGFLPYRPPLFQSQASLSSRLYFETHAVASQTIRAQGAPKCCYNRSDFFNRFHDPSSLSRPIT